MAGIKITDLPAAPSATLTDVFPIDQGAVTYKEDNQQVLTLFKANGEALSRTNDTNVTMTLGGAPLTSLLNATSMTLGWTGSLAVSRGGTDNTTFTAYSVICAGTTATGAFQNVVGLGTAGEQLTSNGPGALPTWQTGTLVTPSALTRVDDTNVTLTLGGTPTTALLQATSITAGWSGQLSVARGGTGLAALTAHYIPIGNGTTALTLLAPNATSGIPLISQGASADPTYGTAVVAGGGTGNTTFTAYSLIAAGTTATGAFQNVSGVGSANQVLVSNGAGLLPTWQSVPGLTPAALTKVDDTNVTLTLGGTPSTSLLQATSITAGWTGQLGLTRGGTAASLTASNGGIVYSTASALAILSGTATAGQMLQSGASTTPAWSTSTYPASNAINTLIYASSANVMAALATANSGVLVTSATGVPSISNGGQIPGTTTNNDASAGNFGEYISASVVSGSAVSMTSPTAKTITSISLTAGDWDVDTFMGTVAGAGTVISALTVGASLTTNVSASELNNSILYNPLIANNVPTLCGPTTRFSLSATTTIYLVGLLVFTVSTAGAFGQIRARRVR